ncbi:MAG: hypothetical protein GDA52_05940 [Rhodobacteraceae bacterium]|nr:hypothetical protein [Paracoccaceae bacterium]
MEMVPFVEIGEVRPIDEHYFFGDPQKAAEAASESPERAASVYTACLPAALRFTSFVDDSKIVDRPNPDQLIASVSRAKEEGVGIPGLVHRV